VTSAVSKTSAAVSSTAASSSATATATGAASCAAKGGKGKGKGKGGKGKGGKGKGGKATVVKRAFTAANAPATLDINIEGKDHSLTKNKDQGASAITYRVTGGSDVGAFAKTPLSGSLKTEADVTKAVGQLISFGTDACSDAEFMVIEAAPGSPLKQTKAFIDGKKESKEKCQEVVDQAVALTVSTAKDIQAKTGFNHGDLNAGNVFFNDDVTSATLIDWGSAKKTSFKAVIAKGQAQISFSGLC
jgi:hypothetical protein